MNWYRKAQLDEEDDLLQEAIVDSIYPEPVSAPSHSACETIYDVEGFKVRLFVASSTKKGELGCTRDAPSRICLQVEDGSPNGTYFKEYPLSREMTDKWGSDRYIYDEKRYEHQSPGNVVGPGFELLPNGRSTFMEYLSTVIPMMKLRMQRFNQLPVKGSIVSRWDRRDPTGKRMVMFSDITPGHIELPFGSMEVCDLDPWWKGYVGLLNRTKKASDIIDIKDVSWEHLTPKEFEAIRKMLETGLGKGAFTLTK